jgi:hypothetical protein
MALSEAQIEKAQTDARAFLEYSILGLCSCLGIPVTSIGDSYEIPVDADDEFYRFHDALARQVAALALLP